MTGMKDRFLKELSAKIEAHRPELEKWYRERLGEARPPVYSSVDLRNGGFKISVVDTNLFPAGFNNLCETFSENAAKRFQEYFERYEPAVRRILILPEEHTRNEYYLKNIEALKKILKTVGFKVKVGLPQEADDFDLVLVNNDLSTGTPDYLRGLTRPILPSPLMGWQTRKKSHHFRLYNLLMKEVAERLEIDPWLLSPLSDCEKEIHLEEEGSLVRLQTTADRLLDRIREKYREHGIRREPYLFIKNNTGTYGMGIIHIQRGEELAQLGRRKKNKLASSKGGREVSEFLLQEGIPTVDLHEGKPLEPVVYLVGGEAVGAFFRLHTEKNELENLNAPGMSFSCLCLHKIDGEEKIEDLFRVGALLGKIASLAASQELAQLRLVTPQTSSPSAPALPYSGCTDLSPAEPQGA